MFEVILNVVLTSAILSFVLWLSKKYPTLGGIIVSLPLSGIGALICGYLSMPQALAAAPFPLRDIEKYRVSLELDFPKQVITGSTLIQLKNYSDQYVEFPIHSLSIDSVVVDNRTASFTATSTVLKIELPSKKTEPFRSIQIRFHGKPSLGLVWGSNYVYTNYDPCGWMICIDDPGIRAPFELELKIPKRMKATASGDLVSVSEQSRDMQTLKWVEGRPYASYLYGFAAGEFEQHLVKESAFDLEFLGPLDSKDELKKKFKDTQRVVKFFEEKSGVKFPLRRYTQVLVPGTEAQEKHGFSVLGKDFVDPILTDPTEDWAIVHELAHQWWGNLLTCKSWEHFWLNEGVVVFMTAAYKQVQWGQATYDREMDLAKKRYQRAVDEKFDVPLTFSGTYPSLGIKRAIVYSKGALFLDALRKDVGEKAFWNGLKEYTIQNQLKSVESKDFQKALEKSAGKSLSKIFERWVY